MPPPSAPALPAFAGLQARASAAIAARMSNALVELASGPLAGVARSVVHDTGLADASPFADVASADAHSLSLWLAPGEEAPREGAALVLYCAAHPQGVRARISSAPDVDDAGWLQCRIALLA